MTKPNGFYVWIIIIVSFLGTHKAFALTKAFQCSKLEIEAVLEDPFVQYSLETSGKISKIETTQEGYKVSTASCSLEVKVIYDLSGTTSTCTPFRLDPTDKRCQ